MTTGVTLPRVMRSEWVKFRSLQSSPVTVISALVAMVALGWLTCALNAGRWSQLSEQTRARLEPTALSIQGYVLVQLAFGVLGVLVVSGEYTTGQIRSTFSAVPARTPVLAAKAAVLAAVAFVIGEVAAFAAFLGGQAFLASQDIETNLAEPGVFRAVFGVGLYLTGVGLLGVALGWLIRHTAGAIAALVALIMVVPALAGVLPESWVPHVVPYLPSNAGQALITVRPSALSLPPWTGFAWFCGYVVVALAAAAVVLKRRDA
ncbi:ABC transporter permease subunit [Amycolatopsis sp. OK19-0408]|uniref:ABC transporter permease subunit n=1 Tax=Amycolatopsis iheyensis TaxID=2945988 RepID=A0A9X2N8D9_9PSEU|nr:ABC transporter permease subunit [Amycolatopsis iheyensis]MCR6482451.1 ABC transporter permease subunit [Amycolatopsis iheyensis]